jgi:hypothetical protein
MRHSGDPPQRQDSHVVRLFGAADKAPHVVDYGSDDTLGIDDGRLRKGHGQPLRGIKPTLGVLRFRDPVGKEQQNLASVDPVVIDRVVEIIDCAERRTTLRDELPQAGAAAEDKGRIVAGAGIVDLA